VDGSLKITQRGALLSGVHLNVLAVNSGTVRVSHLIQKIKRVAVPLLGAGCRGFPISVAIEAAARASTSWLSQSTTFDGIYCSLGQGQNETIHSDCVIAFG
jgi:O-acetyl-ADP-ribose deacetylase (regulator of RNase III)